LIHTTLLVETFRESWYKLFRVPNTTLFAVPDSDSKHWYSWCKNLCSILVYKALDPVLLSIWILCWIMKMTKVSGHFFLCWISWLRPRSGSASNNYLSTIALSGSAPKNSGVSVLCIKLSLETAAFRASTLFPLISAYVLCLTWELMFTGWQDWRGTVPGIHQLRDVGGEGVQQEAYRTSFTHLNERYLIVRYLLINYKYYGGHKDWLVTTVDFDTSLR